MNYQQSKIEINPKKTFKVQSLSQFCSKSYSAYPRLFSASVATMKLKQKKAQTTILLFLPNGRYLPVPIQLTTLFHFSRKAISPSICSQRQTLFSSRFLPPHSAHQHSNHQPNSERDSCLSQVLLLYFSSIVGLGRKGCTHTQLLWSLTEQLVG